MQCEHSKTACRDWRNFLAVYHCTLPWYKPQDTRQPAGLDWENILQQSLSHRIFAFFWSALAKTETFIIPETISQQYKFIVIDNIAHGLFLTGTLVEIIALFNREGIEIIPFKGPELALRLYGDFTNRSYGDLDILVSEEEAFRAYCLLVAQDYEPELVLSAQQFGSYLRHEDNISLTHQRTKVVVELHWELSGKYLATPFDYHFIHQRLYNKLLDKKKVRVLSDEDLLIYFCLHGTKHGWSQLELVDCLARLIDQAPQLDWLLVDKLAGKLCCRRMVLLGLGLAESITLSSLPARISEKIKADSKLQKLLRSAEDNMSMAAVSDMPQKDPKFSTLRLTVRDSFIDQLGYMFKLIFRPSNAQWKRYKLPGCLSFLHYILRPWTVLRETIVGLFSGKWTKM